MATHKYNNTSGLHDYCDKVFNVASLPLISHPCTLALVELSCLVIVPLPLLNPGIFSQNGANSQCTKIFSCLACSKVVKLKLG